jgi:hypothetical protein
VHLLARLVRLAVTVVSLILIVAIALRLFDVRSELITDWARWLSKPFRSVFSADDPKLEVTLDYGLAMVVYAVAGGVVASLLDRGTRIGPTGQRA